MSVYDYSAKLNNGTEKSLADYKGKTLIIVNTASKCGLTPQYEGLEELYKSYRSQGLEILGFPCNQFGAQEPGTNEEIEQFCKLNYGVSFPLFSKIDVNGEETHPLYKYLKEEAPGEEGGDIKWNFTKFLINGEGRVVKRFEPKVTPQEMESDIQAALGR